MADGSDDEVTEKLKIMQASIDALCIKSRGYTYNLITPSFYEYHSFFNLTIKWLQEASYEVAERVRSLGAVANFSLAEIAELSLIDDATSPLSDTKKMTKALLADHTTIAELAREVFKIAAKEGDAGTVGLMTSIAKQAEHFAWELWAMTK